MAFGKVFPPVLSKLFSKVHPRLIQVAQGVLLIGLFVLLWRTMDGREALNTLLGANLWWIGAAALVLTFQTVLSAQRWRLTAAQLGITIAPVMALREYYLAQFVNQSLPGGVIGDAGRAVRSRQQAGLAMASQAVIYERLAGQAGLLVVFLFGLPLSLVLPSGFVWPSWLAWLVVAGLLGLAAIPFILGLMLRISSSRETALRRVLGKLYQALAAPDVVKAQIVLSLGTALCNLAAFAFCATAMGVSLPLLAVLTLVPIILFSMLLPLTIGGWGVREGAAAVLFPLVGATTSDGLATSVAFGLVIAGAVLPGLLLSWLAARKAEKHAHEPQAGVSPNE